MLLFLVRHGHAEKGDPDDLRPLSERGRDEARAVARQLTEHATPPALVLTSPLLRARQTAEQIAQATGAELRVDERIAPGLTPDLLIAALDEERGPVAVVGHQPDFSEVAFALTGSDPGFATGGVAEIAVEKGSAQDSG
jgi:phosphohistidine phosphatase